MFLAQNVTWVNDVILIYWVLGGKDFLLVVSTLLQMLFMRGCTFPSIVTNKVAPGERTGIQMI